MPYSTVTDHMLPVDRRVPLLIVKVGHYPLHHGTLAAVRSLGRLGVPVYAVTESRTAPVALSRYLTGHFVWRTTGDEDPAELIAVLCRIGERLNTPAVALATDDEAAILLATYRDKLAGLFLLPAVDPDLPGRLADKQELYELCRRHSAATPRTVFPESPAQLADAVADVGLPAVVKNCRPWGRLTAPAVSGTTILRTGEQVAALHVSLCRSRHTPFLVQEYLPGDSRSPWPQDWFAHFYRDGDARTRITFTGLKLRSWPPGGGVTTRGIALPNSALTAAVADFCERIGYRGVGDTDWRFDHRDGQLKLVDFNPRVGAQFQLFRSTSGLDVVRALHLGLSQRTAPAGRQVDRRELVVEHLDAAAAIAELLRGRVPTGRPKADQRELAWFAWDDPLPFAAATTQFALSASRKAVRRLTPRRTNRS